MDTRYQGLLPQGARVINELNDEHTYELPPSMTYCFPFRMRRYYQQLIVDVADTTPFESCFVPVIRSWASEVPVGMSMTAQPLASQGTVNPGPDGVTWNFFLIDMVESSNLIDASIRRWIDPGKTYWMNIQNMQNKKSFFWLRFTFHGVGITHVE